MTATPEQAETDIVEVTEVEPAGCTLPRRAWSPHEVAGQLGVKYRSVLSLIRSGQLGALRVGQHYIVPDVELERYLRSAQSDAQERAS